MSAVHDLRTGEEIDPIEAAYRRVKAQHAAAMAEAQQFGGPCGTCRHFRKSGSSFLYEHYCDNPLVVDVAFDRSAGAIVAKGQSIKSWRQSRERVPEVCGEDRQLWEPRPTLWQRLIAWITGK